MTTTITAPAQDAAEIARVALAHLERVLAIDSASDERSETIPSTPGQTMLARELVGFFEGFGAQVERDTYANVIASWAGRGAAATAPPLALLVHLDTARGTVAVPGLDRVPSWDGGRIPYRENAALCVDVETYPSLRAYVGQDVLVGPGTAPVGLDDKLGLTHLMTLAWLLHTNPGIPHPPLLLVARPDEEIGRMEALLGIAELLAQRGVRSGYTIDGLEPFEINTENFYASQASIRFAAPPRGPLPEASWFALRVGGVNTHGATAKAEGHRPATRLCAELAAALAGAGRAATFTGFRSDPARDCDATLVVGVAGDGVRAALEAALAHVVGPHVPRGASYSLEPCGPPEALDATAEVLAFVGAFLASAPGFVLSAEDSEGRQGYSQPFRALPDEAGGASDIVLDVRLRDFDEDALRAREDHVRGQAGARPVAVRAQYVNMGPRLADRPELVRWAQEAAAAVGGAPRILPIRGGTGVDPFLDRGVAIANLGTGYFAPESEKELTSTTQLVDHARWLTALVQVAAGAHS